MNEKLKPCPFCGGEAEFHVIANSASHGGASFTFEIVCSKCKVSLPKQHTIGVDMNSTGAIVARHDGQLVQALRRRLVKDIFLGLEARVKTKQAGNA